MTPEQVRVIEHPAFGGRVDTSAGSDGCWPFRVGADRAGYGRVRWQGRSWRVHRLANFIATGDLPEATCHRCDNPPCINPSHLWSGTQAENASDMWAKGRQRCASPVLTQQQARALRATWMQGVPAQALAEAFGVSRRTVYRVLYTKANDPKCYQPAALERAA